MTCSRSSNPTTRVTQVTRSGSNTRFARFGSLYVSDTNHDHQYTKLGAQTEEAEPTLNLTIPTQSGREATLPSLTISGLTGLTFDKRQASCDDAGNDTHPRLPLFGKRKVVEQLVEYDSTSCEVHFLCLLHLFGYSFVDYSHQRIT